MQNRKAFFLTLAFFLVWPGYAQFKEAKKEKNEPRYVLATSRDSRPIADARKSVVTVLRPDGGQGSAFVVSANGLMLTNEHVVRNAPKCRIVSLDGQEFEGLVLTKDSKRDVAAIIVRNCSLPTLKIRSSIPKIGEEVFAIGTPNGLFGTVTKGVIGNFVKLKNETWLQGDAAINPGNSGGPIVDTNGNVVGISTLGGDGTTQGIFFYCPIMEAVARLKLQEMKAVIWYKPRTWYRWFL